VAALSASSAVAFAGAVAAVAFFVAVFFAGAFLAVVDLLAVDLAVDFFAGAAFLAAEAADLVVLAAFATVSFGSFLAPETTFLRSAPGLNFGTAVFFALIRSPVCGLRTHRAARMRFSNEPKPVIASVSPFATSRVMVSSTDSNAWAAAFRLPSNRAASTSIS